MIKLILKKLSDWNSNQERLAQEKQQILSKIVTYSGAELPGKTVTILGTVAAENGFNNDNAARESIKLKAYELGANYIINYTEKNSELGLFTCFGDAVIAIDK